MVIGIDMGHTLSGLGTGATGCGYKEQDLTRELGKEVIALLKQEKHTVIDCTCDKASSNNAQLKERVDRANKYNLDLFVSIHFNAFNNQAKGTEVLICKGSTKAKPYATRICDNICKLGFLNRGVKESGVYVVKNTKAPALLIETCFIDNSGDMNIYSKNVQKVAKAIAEGIIGKSITAPIETPTSAPSGLYAVCVGAYNYDNANNIKDELIKKGYKDTYLIPR